MNRARTGLWGALVWLLQPHLGLPGQGTQRTQFNFLGILVANPPMPWRRRVFLVSLMVNLE